MMKAKGKKQKTSFFSFILHPSSFILPNILHPSSFRTSFTLIELLIVILVISILAVIAVPPISASLESTKAAALAREIATDIRYAQMLAVKTGIQHRVSFWLPGHAYAVYRWENGDWQICQHPITKKDWRPLLDQHSRYAGLTLREAVFGGDEYVIFDKYGAPGTGGYVSVTLGATTRTINVAPLSGKVTVE